MQQNSSLNNCTYASTKDTYVSQYWKHCHDCFPSMDEGACLTCIHTCHQGHTLGPLKYSKFYCDCGSKNICKTVIPISSVNPSKNPFDLYPIYVEPIKPRIRGPSITAGQEGKNETSKFANTSNSLALNMIDNFRGHTFSPASIAFALSLIHLGADNNTDKELTSCLNGKMVYNDIQNAHKMLNNDIVKTANALLISTKTRMNENYPQMVNSIALVSRENFADNLGVCSKVNSFVETNTNGMIKNLLSPTDINEDIALLLINTIYFKANWEKAFKAYKTTPMAFNMRDQKYSLRGNLVPPMVKMMNQTGKFNYFENETIQMIEMNYTTTPLSPLSTSSPSSDIIEDIALDFSMDRHGYVKKDFYRPKKCEYTMGVVLPKSTLDVPRLDINLIHQMKQEEINVFFPKFTQKTKVNLVPILQNLGVKNLFIPFQAELSGIAENIHVSKIIHEAVVIVDENGTEASAATAVSCEFNCVSSRENDPIVFKANHTFLYYIRHIESNTILFIGEYKGDTF